MRVRSKTYSGYASNCKSIPNQLPDIFIDINRVTKSNIPAVNVPARIEIPKDKITLEPKPQVKRGRPSGSKDKNSRKKKETKTESNEKIISVETKNFQDEDNVNNKEEISINYNSTEILWNRDEINLDDEIS